MTTALDTQFDEDIDVLVGNHHAQPKNLRLWPIATENQLLASSMGWEKIPKSSTNAFPVNKATVRIQGYRESLPIYGVYFLHSSRQSGYGYVYSERLIVTAYGTSPRKWGFNGYCFTGGQLQEIHDTVEHIESRMMEYYSHKIKLSGRKKPSASSAS